MDTLRSILVPIDGSDPSLAALDHAMALAADYGALLYILHVLDSEHELSPDAQADADAALNRGFVQAMEELGDAVSVRTVRGEPVREIVESATEVGVDLIVIGTHGRIGRLHALAGSVAESVIRNAPCPVLAVRDPTGGYQSFAERRHPRPSVSEAGTAEAHAPGHGR